MSIKSKIYGLINSRTPQEILFALFLAFAVGSILTLIISLIAWVNIVAIVLYTLHYIASNYNLRKEEKTSET